MALPTVETLQRAAAQTGYPLNTLEKVGRLLDMLAEINCDPVLANRLALKGGTALNVFYLDLARLSVDIDFNYIGALDRTAMKKHRPEIDAAIENLLKSKGYDVRHRPNSHGGGKWVSRYASALGGNSTMELDVNYMQRQPLFGAARMKSSNLAGMGSSGILVLDLHEIVAEKIVALVSRRAVRDLFDSRRMLSIDELEWNRVKTAVLAIGACSRFDWRDVSVNNIEAPIDSSHKLQYCLPQGYFLKTGDIDAWVEETITLCRERFASLFQRSADEQEFLDRILDHGEIQPGLLKEVDPDTRTRIGAMPMLVWKAMHVRKHRSGNDLDLDEDTPVPPYLL